MINFKIICVSLRHELVCRRQFIASGIYSIKGSSHSSTHLFVCLFLLSFVLFFDFDFVLFCFMCLSVQRIKGIFFCLRLNFFEPWSTQFIMELPQISHTHNDFNKGYELSQKRHLRSPKFNSTLHLVWSVRLPLFLE